MMPLAQQRQITGQTLPLGRNTRYSWLFAGNTEPASAPRRSACTGRWPTIRPASPLRSWTWSTTAPAGRPPLAVAPQRHPGADARSPCRPRTSARRPTGRARRGTARAARGRQPGPAIMSCRVALGHVGRVPKPHPEGTRNRDDPAVAAWLRSVAAARAIIGNAALADVYYDLLAVFEAEPGLAVEAVRTQDAWKLQDSWAAARAVAAVSGARTAIRSAGPVLASSCAPTAPRSSRAISSPS
jgi:hypothetical protein